MKDSICKKCNNCAFVNDTKDIQGLSYYEMKVENSSGQISYNAMVGAFCKKTTCMMYDIQKCSEFDERTNHSIK